MSLFLTPGKIYADAQLPMPVMIPVLILKPIQELKKRHHQENVTQLS